MFSDNFESTKAMTIRSKSLGLQWGSNNKNFTGMNLEEVKENIESWYKTRQSPVYRGRMLALLNSNDLELISNE